MDVLFAQRDLLDARMVLIDTKRQQLSAIVNAYQALGGGGNSLQNPGTCPAPLPIPLPVPLPAPDPLPQPATGQLPLPEPGPGGPKQPPVKPAAVVPAPEQGVELMPVTRIEPPPAGK